MTQQKKGKQYHIKNPSSARDCANVILIGVNDHGKKSGMYLREVLDKNNRLDTRDKALAQRLVAGTLEHLFAIDALLDEVSDTPVEKMDPYVRCALRTAVCQMRYMDRIPESAAINEAVELTKLQGLSRLGGFVNGVLRTVARRRQQENEGEKTLPGRCEAQSLRYSVPQWLCTKLTADFGAGGAQALFESWMLLRKVSVRFNLSRGRSEKEILSMLTSQKIGAEKILDGPMVYELSNLSGIGVAGLEAFRQGLICVQDSSAAMVTRLSPPRKGDTVLDLCASPGGKSLAYADALCGSGLVTSRDVSEEKLSLIRDNVRRCGFTNIRIERGDATVADPSLHADIVLVDAPCSGLGVVAKKPDIKKNIQPDSILSLQKLQRQILKQAANYVNPGGRLVYSTCTITKEENEDNFDWICENLPVKPVEKCRIQPDLHHDGFFIAVFERMDLAASTAISV